MVFDIAVEQDDCPAFSLRANVIGHKQIEQITDALRPGHLVSPPYVHSWPPGKRTGVGAGVGVGVGCLGSLAVCQGVLAAALDI